MRPGTGWQHPTQPSLSRLWWAQKTSFIGERHPTNTAALACCVLLTGSACVLWPPPGLVLLRAYKMADGNLASALDSVHLIPAALHVPKWTPPISSGYKAPTNLATIHPIRPNVQSLFGLPCPASAPMKLYEVWFLLSSRKIKKQNRATGASFVCVSWTSFAIWSPQTREESESRESAPRSLRGCITVDNCQSISLPRDPRSTPGFQSYRVIKAWRRAPRAGHCSPGRMSSGVRLPGHKESPLVNPSACWV